MSPTDFQNEPLLDFSQEAARHRMETALQTAWRQFGAVYPLLINGEEIATPETFPSPNPAHKKEVVGYLARATREHVEQAVAGAKADWPTWRDTPPAARAACLRRAAELLSQQRLGFAAWEVFEVGKTWREADADVAEAIDFLRYYTAEIVSLAAGRPVYQAPGERNQYVYVPRGVGAVIAPWNFPLAILTGMTAAALVTGNATIVKPSSQSAVLAAKLVRLLHQAGIPAGIVQFLPGGGSEVGAALADHPDIQFIAFTGSRAVGLALSERAARVPQGQRHVKKVIAEMGGKNAIIVDADADLDEAIPGILTSAFGYQGQKCSACSRLIVHQDIYEALLPRLLEATDSLPIGFPEDPRSVIGPLIDAEAQRRVRNWIATGEQTACLVYQKEVGALAEEGWFVGPVIFTEVDPYSPLAQEEIFGPVLSVLKARDFAEALAIANDTDYALTGGLYSRSLSHIEEASRRFEVGNLYINRRITGAVVGRQPFGGYKLSGIGSKAGGPDYLLQFLIPKTITENTLRHGLPL